MRCRVQWFLKHLLFQTDKNSVAKRDNYSRQSWISGYFLVELDHGLGQLGLAAFRDVAAPQRVVGDEQSSFAELFHAQLERVEVNVLVRIKEDQIIFVFESW